MEPSSPNRLVAVFAGLVPLVLGGLCCVLSPFVAVDRVNALEVLGQDVGAPFYALVIGASVAALVAGLLVGSSASGARVPTALAFFMAALPWVLGFYPSYVTGPRAGWGLG